MPDGDGAGQAAPAGTSTEVSSAQRGSPNHPPGKGCYEPTSGNSLCSTGACCSGFGGTDCLSNRFTAGDTNLGLIGRRVLNPVPSGGSLQG